ncbi:MAG TPA: hypothetical protein VFN65_11125 [Solirubrobacteraceae bacterium]|nr:hypothetical protein [Solirubrobacteraceae bacterium]
MELSAALNLRELQRYLGRVGDRWPLQMVLLAGARVADVRADATHREARFAQTALREERGPEFVVVLVSEGFAGMPWLERLHQAGALWDALEMGDGADIHCFTPAEYLRRRETTPAVRAAAERGVLLYADTEPFTAAAPGL